VSRCKLSEQNFENFIIRGRFSQKNAIMSRKWSSSGDFRPPELRNDNRSPHTHGQNKSVRDVYSFHFYRWNQLKLIPLPSTLRTRTFLPPNVSLLIIGCGLLTMRYICNQQVAPLTICIQQLGAIRPISLTIKNSNCAKDNFDYR